MRKITLLIHVSLDGFTAGPNGEMDWIKVDDEIFDVVAKMTDDADTALFGRKTYELMESYWPTAAEKPNASKHDIEHANWVNNAEKIVFSNTIKKSGWKNTTIINGDIKGKIQELKSKPGKDILIIGSADIARTFINLGLIDEFFINLNPVILGEGISFFKDIRNRINLKLINSITFKSGVVGLHFETIK